MRASSGLLPRQPSRRPAIFPLGAGLALILTAAWALAALAAEPNPLVDLRAIHRELSKDLKSVSLEDADRAAARLSRLKLIPAALAPAEQRTLFEAELHIALASGDAAAALKKIDELELLAPTDAGVAQLTLLTATGAGDALLAQEALQRQREGADAETLKLLSVKQRRLKMVGRPAPDEAITPDEGAAIGLRDRNGIVLILDFWALRHKAEAPTWRGLSALHETYKQNVAVQFLGVNSDPPARLEQAREFAGKQFHWPQLYEKRSSDAPLTARGFQAGAPPWQVLIDARGVVRAVGDADDAGFVSAVRAAVAEAAGRYPRVEPRSLDDKPRERPKPREPAPRKGAAAGSTTNPSTKPAKSTADKEAEKEKPAPVPEEEEEASEKPADAGKRPAEPPSRDEAASLVRQARAYIKTGKKTEARKLLEQVVAQFPNTREAKEAAEMLRTL